MVGQVGGPLPPSPEVRHAGTHWYCPQQNRTRGRRCAPRGYTTGVACASPTTEACLGSTAYEQGSLSEGTSEHACARDLVCTSPARGLCLCPHGDPRGGVLHTEGEGLWLSVPLPSFLSSGQLRIVPTLVGGRIFSAVAAHWGPYGTVSPPSEALT